ncbi:MAG: TetR/AcrR family transcriptional regulator [Candidatus Nanopelagicales bacterium]|nr:TetR/AcrR family transcriptional regulator [Candidatus Nanopelagicales bacterium]MCF8557973.1 TetR/AcrR family transcriptional regulator [Candidatus Nanopelagicales bacterium]
MTTPATAPRAPRLPREERRLQVLAAALEVFSAVGYHAASMDEIAERAGVSKPVLYQHFPGKLELYLELLDNGVEDWLAAARQALTGTTDNATRVEAMVRAYFRFVEEPGGAFRLVFESDLAHEPAVRERVDAADLTLTTLSASVIAEDTGLSHDQAMLLASGMHGLVQVSARNWMRSGEDRPPREQAAELVASLAWRGISSFPLSHPPQAE